MKKLTQKQAKKAMNLNSLGKSILLTVIVFVICYFVPLKEKTLVMIIISVFSFLGSFFLFRNEFQVSYFDLSKWIVVKDNLVVKGEWIKREKKDSLKMVWVGDRFNSFSEGISMKFLHGNNLLLEMKLTIVFSFKEDVYQKLYDLGGLDCLCSPIDKLVSEIKSWFQDLRIEGLDLFSKISNQYKVDEEVNNFVDSCFKKSKLNDFLKIEDIKIQL